MSTDREIIQRARSDPEAFGRLFERHSASIAGSAARRVGAAAAEDVLSATFHTAFRTRSRFDGSWESAKPWLFGIATRVIAKHRAAEAGRARRERTSVHAASDDAHPGESRTS